MIVFQFLIERFIIEIVFTMLYWWTINYKFNISEAGPFITKAMPSLPFNS